MSAALEVEGLRELLAALKQVEHRIYPELVAAMREVGDVVRDDARRRFSPVDRFSAQGFETRVRPSSEALVIVGQRLRKTTGNHPEWGARQMREALLPARHAKYDEANEILEKRMGRLLRAHGF